MSRRAWSEPSLTEREMAERIARLVPCPTCLTDVGAACAGPRACESGPAHAARRALAARWATAALHVYQYEEGMP